MTPAHIARSLTTGQRFILRAAVEKGALRCGSKPQGTVSRSLEKLGLVCREDRGSDGEWIVPTDLGRDVDLIVSAE